MRRGPSRSRPPRWRREAAAAAAGQSWRSRPVLAGAIKALVVLIPALAAISTTALLNWGTEPPRSVVLRVFWWALLFGVSTVVAIVVERQTRRLLPLAVLFKLTLLFPDEAPSRYRLARAAGNPQRLRELAAGSSPRSRAATHVLAWVGQLAKHDRHTRGHSERVRVFSDLIAEQMQIGGQDRDKLRWAALLHDIGKLQVPATLLNKAGKPTATEWDVLRQHPAAGTALLGPLAAWLGPWAGGIADHHERFDGTGYPQGLAGEQISPAGRIVAVADAYETMTASRSYKRAAAAATAREELARCGGTHFDPAVVRAFLAVGLPRILYGIGPLSFLVHLPFLARVPDAGLGLLTVAGQAAAPVAAGLTAASFATAVVVSPTPPASTVADSTAQIATSSHHAASSGKAGVLSILGSPGTVARLTGTAPTPAGSPAASGALHDPAPSGARGVARPKPGSSAPPKASDPNASNPTASNPTASNPKASNPKASNPQASNPQASNPKASNPKASNPATSKPAKPAQSTPSKPSKPSTGSGKKPTTVLGKTASASASRAHVPKPSKH